LAGHPANISRCCITEYGGGHILKNTDLGFIKSEKADAGN